MTYKLEYRKFGLFWQMLVFQVGYQGILCFNFRKCAIGLDAPIQSYPPKGFKYKRLVSKRSIAFSLDIDTPIIYFLFELIAGPFLGGRYPHSSNSSHKNSDSSNHTLISP